MIKQRAVAANSSLSSYFTFSKIKNWTPTMITNVSKLVSGYESKDLF